MPREPRTQGYRVRLSPREKRDLEKLADRCRVTVAHAFRAGARLYLKGLRDARS